MTHSALERLQQDHHQIETLLWVLERQTAAVSSGDRPDYALMHQILHYLTYFPDQYHHVFEDLLFERLARRRADMLEVIKGLSGQHETLTALGMELRTLMEAILNDSPVDRADLTYHGREYIAQYRDHLEYEESRIFPALSENLTQSDWLELLTQFEWRADPLFTNQANKEYALLEETLHIMGVDPGTLKDSLPQDCPVCSGRWR